MWRWTRYFVGLVLVLSALVGVGVFLFPNLSNPFRVDTVDRTGPSVLQSLTDLSEFHAASAYYETVVDIEKDVRYLPGWVSGERVLYVGKGDVHGIVDFSELDESRVTVSDDGVSVAIALPEPAVGEPVLDLKESYVFDHSRGFTDRFGESDLGREAQLKAVEQMMAAASGEGKLIDRAKKNTVSMLNGLLGALGYTTVEVAFDGDSPATASD